MDLIIKDEKRSIEPYEFNFEELKADLEYQLESYTNLVVTDDAIKEAKTSRANLNRLKKDLSSKVASIKKTHLKPFNEFKEKTDILINLIEEPILQIDTQVKCYEQKVKDDKKAEIVKYWDGLNIFGLQERRGIDCIFNTKWLNSTYQMKLIKDELDEFATKVRQDFELIEEFKSEFNIVLIETYLETLDLSKVMAQKKQLEYIQEQKELERVELEKIQQEQIAKEIEENKIKEQKEIEKIEITEPIIENKTVIDEPKQPIVEETRKYKLLSVNVDKEQFTTIVNFLRQNKIEFNFN